MSEFQSLTDGGMRAVWRGREYRLKSGGGIGQRWHFLIPADPNEPHLEGAVYDEKLGGYGIPIDPAELDAWYSTSWYFDWRGQGFRATSRSEDQINGHLMSGDDRWAKANGLTLFDRAWAVGLFPISEIENLREERHDLLAKWKSERARAELKRGQGK